MKYPFDTNRLAKYQYFDELGKSNHFEAFAQQSNAISKEYKALKYITANFLGLSSKIFADLLFGRSAEISVADGDNLFLDNLINETGFNTILHTSALKNSRRGDAVFRVRVETKNDKKRIVIDDISPSIYFVELENTVTNTTKCQKLVWTVERDDKTYLLQEIHTIGLIEYKANELEKNGDIGAAVNPSAFQLPEQLPTLATQSLLIHIPNFRQDEDYWGVSDYQDMVSLQFALNNRLTKIEDVLDKHSFPILTLPQHILDNEGKFDRSTKVIELDDDMRKPEYLNWDANLSSAFTQIDKILEMAFMVGEISPETLGLGKGGLAESGRALKFKLLRSLSKKDRKARFYEEAIKHTLFVAQELAYNFKISINGLTMAKPPAMPEVKFDESLLVDMTEAVNIENTRLEQGTTTVIDAIMRLDNVDRDIAEKKKKEIDEENETPKAFELEELKKTYNTRFDKTNNSQITKVNENATGEE